jgi:hypothetical protein
MQVELVTKEDLQLFRQQLLHDLKSFITNPQPQPSQWLRSGDVRKLLKISAGTLQNLRINAILNPVKIGGSFYYQSSEIQNILNSKHQSS